MYIMVIYEDPENKNTPMSVDLVLDKGKKGLTLVSPIIKKIENSKTYKVEFLLYKDAKRTKLVNKHIQFIDFFLPLDRAPEFDLEFLFSDSVVPKTDTSTIEKLNIDKYQSPYPSGSGVAVSEILERDAIKALKVFLNQTYGDESFEIISRKSHEEIKGFSIDDKGRLIEGKLRETWLIKQNEDFHKLEFIMYSDGNLGNYCGFKKSTALTEG